MNRSPMPGRRKPLKARKPMGQGAGPMRTPLTGQRAPMLGCGKAYATEAAARRSKRGQTAGAEFEQCPVRECRRWHVRLPGSQRAGLAGRRDTGPDAETRAAVYRRDGNQCVCCGTPLAGKARSVGHRVRRSQGGSNETSNLLTFMGLGMNPFDPDDHHARIDSRLNPEDEARGYSLRSFKDPHEEGVMIMSSAECGQTVLLSDDGEYLFAPPEGVAA